jgi:hypothetical protein
MCDLLFWYIVIALGKIFYRFLYFDITQLKCYTHNLGLHKNSVAYDQHYKTKMQVVGMLHVKYNITLEMKKDEVRGIFKKKRKRRKEEDRLFTV